jgi:hypothetical protein
MSTAVFCVLVLSVHIHKIWVLCAGLCTVVSDCAGWGFVSAIHQYTDFPPRVMRVTHDHAWRIWGSRIKGNLVRGPPSVVHILVGL